MFEKPLYRQSMKWSSVRKVFRLFSVRISFHIKLVFVGTGKLFSKDMSFESVYVSPSITTHLMRFLLLISMLFLIFQPKGKKNMKICLYNFSTNSSTIRSEFKVFFCFKSLITNKNLFNFFYCTKYNFN